MESIIWARVESEMFRLQPVGVGVGPVGVRVVTAHGRRCDSWWYLSGRGAGLRGGNFEVVCGSFHVITSSLESRGKRRRRNTIS